MSPLKVFLGNQTLCYLSVFITVVVGSIVLLIINPMIDGGNGATMIALQLSFDKATGIDVVQAWPAGAVVRYNQLIISDYLFAACYGWCLSSVMVYLRQRAKMITSTTWSDYGLLFPASATVLDWVEDTLQWFFVNHLQEFSGALFTLHSVLASIKFVFIVLSIMLVIRLIVLCCRQS